MYCDNCQCDTCARKRNQVRGRLTSEEFALLKTGEQPKVIKMVRDRTGMSLFDCRILVERWRKFV